MKSNTLWTWLRFAALLCAAIGAVAPIHAAEPVKLIFISEDIDNFPYETGDGETFLPERPGISVELLQRVAQRLHIEIEFKRFPWKRCFVELQQGRVTGLFSASFKPERMESGAYPMRGDALDESKRIYTSSYSLYALKGTAIRWDGATFASPPKNVGAMRGYSIVDDLKKMGIPVTETKDIYVAFKQLHNRNLDAVAALELAGDAMLAQYLNEFPAIQKIVPPLTSKHYYLMLSHQFIRQSPQLAEEIWNALADIRESAEFKRDMERYFQQEPN